MVASLADAKGVVAGCFVRIDGRPAINPCLLGKDGEIDRQGNDFQTRQGIGCFS